jgi:hypothetical protein
MNLLDLLKARIDTLPDGDYTLGLSSILQHIEVAENHLLRGQTNADETAFTDSIYRTNQAFEGSLKEAFRVLAQRDPSRETPNQIETYLQNENVLRPRVLAQLTNYRKDWRNPSTHDYCLNFDEDEALLAIVNVSAFAIVLIDQMTERISYEQAKLNAVDLPISSVLNQPILERLSMLIEQFIVQFKNTHLERSDIREVEIIGALSGFLASAAPDFITKVDTRLLDDKPERPDLLISRVPKRVDLLVSQLDESVIVEIKISHLSFSRVRRNGIEQVSNYMAISGIKNAILLIFNTPNIGTISKIEEHLPDINGKIVVICTDPLLS